MRPVRIFRGLSVYICVGFLAACGSSSPTAPTPPPVATTPPVIITPPTTPEVVTPPTPPAPAFPPNDPRFDMAFYRQFVHDGSRPLRRQREAPRVYLRTVDEAGTPIDALTLTQTAAALEATAGSLTGVFGIAALEMGTGNRRGQSGWITVIWLAQQTGYCGAADVAGDYIELSPRTPGCRCAGGPAVRLRTVRHELGHALGFYHTDAPTDLMYGTGSTCDQHPSAREVYHASVAYQRPIGSPAP